MKNATCLTDDQRWQSVLARDPNADSEFVFAVRTTGIFAVRLAAPDMPCGKMSPSTQMPARHSPPDFAPANAANLIKPMPSNIGWIKSPTRVDCWNRKRL